MNTEGKEGKGRWRWWRRPKGWGDGGCGRAPGETRQVSPCDFARMRMARPVGSQGPPAPPFVTGPGSLIKPMFLVILKAMVMPILKLNRVERSWWFAHLCLAFTAGGPPGPPQCACTAHTGNCLLPALTSFPHYLLGLHELLSFPVCVQRGEHG